MNNDFIVTAKDGYPLAAIKYSAKKPKANIILAGATAVPQAFYRRFSEYVERWSHLFEQLKAYL